MPDNMPPKGLPILFDFFFDGASKKIGLGLVKVLLPFQSNPLLRIPAEDIQAWISSLDAVKNININDYQGDQIPQFVEGLTSAFLAYAGERQITLWERLVAFMTMSILTDRLGGADSEREFIQSFSPHKQDGDSDKKRDLKVNYDDYIQDLLIQIVSQDAKSHPAAPLALQFLTNKVLMPKRGIIVIDGEKEKILTDYLSLRNGFEQRKDEENNKRSKPSVHRDWQNNLYFTFILNQYDGSSGVQLEPRPGLSFVQKLKYALGGDKRKYTTAAIFRTVLILLCAVFIYLNITKGA